MIGFSVAKLIRTVVTQKISNFTSVAFSRKYLLATNVTISFVLSGVGDVLEQNYRMASSLQKRLDKHRTAKMAVSGITVGVMCHYYYELLDRFLPGRSASMLAKKVLLDQLVCSPVLIFVFLVTVGYIEGKTLQQFMGGMRDKGWQLYKADWIVWPPAQVINFYFIPLRFRVLYDSMISLGYDVYTSYVNNDYGEDAERTES